MALSGKPGVSAHRVGCTAKRGGLIEHVAAPTFVANFPSGFVHELIGALAQNTGAAGEVAAGYCLQCAIGANETTFAFGP
jgi:hypothetical protein